jgi:hypothetical protein
MPTSLHENQVRGRTAALLDTSPSGIPIGYVTTVYRDDGAGTLFPRYPVVVTDPKDVLEFKAGHGATGKAFGDGTIIMVVGPVVSNDGHRLLKTQLAAIGLTKPNCPQSGGVGIALGRANRSGRHEF